MPFAAFSILALLVLAGAAACRSPEPPPLAPPHPSNEGAMQQVAPRPAPTGGCGLGGGREFHLLPFAEIERGAKPWPTESARVT